VKPWGGFGWATTFSFDGIPEGTSLIVGNELVVRLFARMIWLPTIDPSDPGVVAELDRVHTVEAPPPASSAVEDFL
jgi:hypothetical protein